MSDSPFVIRPLEPADQPFLFSSWLKSYRDSPTVRGVSNTHYYSAHHAVIERLLPMSIARVACDANNPHEIFGYAVGQAVPDGAALHWVYVKHALRGYGIARELIASLPTITHYTHRVKNMDRLLKDRPYAYNPYLLG